MWPPTLPVTLPLPGATCFYTRPYFLFSEPEKQTDSFKWKKKEMKREQLSILMQSTPQRTLLVGWQWPSVSGQLKEKDKASSFHWDISVLIRRGKCHIRQKVMSVTGQPGHGEGDTRQSCWASPGTQARMQAGTSEGDAQASKCSVALTVSDFCDYWMFLQKRGEKTNILFKCRPDGKFSACLIENTGACLHDYLFH